MAMPLERLQHPFHLRHALTLSTTSSVERICHACHKSFHGSAYRCQECDVDFDLVCASLQPLIEIGIHDHKLTLFKKLYSEPECCACNSNTLKSFYLRCVECDYNIHLMCCSLPKSIKHESHQGHSLSLEDFFVEDKSDDYCDNCEQIINPQESVYCCEECHFVVDFNCVIKELLVSLVEGEGRDMKLRKRSRKITVEKLFSSLNDESNFKLYVNRKLQNSGSSELDLFGNPDEVVVKVGVYMIPRNLAPILENILGIYGDIGAECHSLTPTEKSVILIMVCGSLQAMSNTKIRHVTEKLLNGWRMCLEIGHNFGFEVQFALHQLMKVHRTRLWNEIQTKKHTILHDIHEGKIKYQKLIDESWEKLEKIDKGIGLHIRSNESESLRKEKQIFYEFLDWRMKTTAGEELLQ